MAAQLGQKTSVHIYRQEVGPPPTQRPQPALHSQPMAPNTIDSLTLSTLVLNKLARCHMNVTFCNNGKANT
jgi:hypothetical protein